MSFHSITRHNMNILGNHRCRCPWKYPIKRKGLRFLELLLNGRELNKLLKRSNQPIEVRPPGTTPEWQSSEIGSFLRFKKCTDLPWVFEWRAHTVYHFVKDDEHGKWGLFKYEQMFLVRKTKNLRTTGRICG